MTAAKKRPVKKPTKKQNKKTESSESDEDFANAEKTTKKKTNKTTQEYKCITKSTEYFMRGDVMWYIAIRRGEFQCFTSYSSLELTQK